MKIYLRPLQEKDAAGMLEWMSDPSIHCFFRFDASKVTLDSCCNYIQLANQSLDCRHFAIADEADNYLGTISLKDIDHEKKTAEYAISTRSCVHGTGAALQATQKILKIAFDELDLEQVYLNVLVENVRANSFYKKVGFQYKYREKYTVEIGNEWRDLNWYVFNREDYLRNKRDGK